MRNRQRHSLLIATLIFLLTIAFVYFSNRPGDSGPGESPDQSSMADSSAGNLQPDANSQVVEDPKAGIGSRKKETAEPFGPIRPRTRAPLTPDGKVAIVSGPAPRGTVDPVSRVLEELRRRGAGEGYQSDDFADPAVSSQTFSKHNGVTHIYLRQKHLGLEVYNGDANGNVAKDGSVLSLHNRFVKNIKAEVNLTEPVITAEDAVVAAARDLGVKVDAPPAVTEAPKGVAREMVFASGDLSQDPIPAKLMYLPMDDARTRLVWNTVLHLKDGARWMDVNVDAENGEVLSLANWYANADYRAFPLPFETPLDGARALVNNPQNATASPFGWHDTNGVAGAEFTDTRGNNVFAQDDTDANNTGGTRPDGGAPLLFDNALDLALAPSTYLPAATTNLFYWNNLLHDIHYQYGFDEVSGNFQESNYGFGGAASDPVDADSQDGSGTNNANFGTPPDGSNPRMQMFVWTAPNPDRDSDLDNVIIIHEYGHGVSNRLTGGPANSSALNAAQSRGMGEGWSDWWGLALTAKPGQASSLNRSVGYYVLGQPTAGAGIRPRPYTTNLAVNEYTYADIRTGLSVPHGIGFVWCSILWEMYWGLVGAHGYDPDVYNGSGGNNIALQLVMDGLKLQPANPTYLEARDAIFMADQVNNGGANSNILWAAFAKRGMGYSASDSGNPDNLAVTEAFDLPDEVFTINDVSVTEGNTGFVNAVFTVTLTPDATEETRVDYNAVNGNATAPVDFLGSTGTLVFAPGQTTKTLSVRVNGESATEIDETFTVTLENAVNARISDGNGVGTIANDDYVLPVINSSLSSFGVENRPLTYQITATNTPRSFSLQGTPPVGMTINASTGVLSWTPPAPGSFPVQIRATNPAGSDTETLVISVGDLHQFTGGGALSIPSSGDATPYPSQISVSGVTGTVTALRVLLNGVSHTWPEDMDIFLVNPANQVCAVVSDAGGDADIVNLDLAFDDTAAEIAPYLAPMAAGTYRPTNHETGEPLPPGATGSIETSLMAIAGGDVNGVWSLFVRDDVGGDSGTITSWGLEFGVSGGTPAAVTLSNLNQTYNGSPRAFSASTNPGGLLVAKSYNGSSTPPTQAGSYPVTATIASPGVDGSAEGVLVIAKAAQVLNFLAIPDQIATSTVNLVAYGGASESAVTLEVIEGPATLIGNQLTFTGAGLVRVAAYQGGNSNYLDAAPVERSFNVNKAPATVQLSNLTQIYNGTPRSATATTTPSGLTLDLTYNGLPTPPTAAGTYTVVATINDLIYQGTATGTFTISKAPQTIGFPPIPDQLVTNVLTLTATGGGSTSPVLFSVSDGPGTLLGLNQVQFSGGGEVTVTANQAGDANFLAASPLSRTFRVTKSPASVTLSDLSQTYDGNPRIVSATTSPPDLQVEIRYNGSPTPPTSGGSYSIVAFIDEELYEGSAVGTLTVSKLPQTIDFPAISDKPADEIVTLLATGGGSIHPVTFTVLSGPGIIEGGNQLRFTDGGLVQVQASQAGDSNYTAATPVSQTFEVLRAAALINLTNLSQTYDGLPKPASATTTPPGLAVNFTYDSLPTAPTNAASYAVVGSMGDTRYNATPANGTLVVGKADQTIAFPPIGDKVTNDTVTLTATGGGASTPVTFAVTGGPGTISGGNLLQFTGTGEVEITASNAGDSNYHPTSIAQTITVNKAEAPVTLSGLLQVADGTPREVVATTTPPGLDVIVTYDGGITPPAAIGTYEVVATIDDPLYEGTLTETLRVVDAKDLRRVPGGTLPSLSSIGALEVSTYQLGRFEVTWGLWREVRDWAAANGYTDLAGLGVGCADDHPVHSVNWYDAVKWCNARTEWENETTGSSLVPAYSHNAGVYRTGAPLPGEILCNFSTSGYRLPTGAEWEYGARGGSSGVAQTYPGGNTIDPLARYTLNSGGADCGLSGGRGTYPVGGKLPNSLGFHDLAGNVAEWTWDADSGNSAARLSLGGSWDSADTACALGAIASEAPTQRVNRVGLRVGRSLASALSAALDNSLVWDSGETSSWHAQTGTTHDGSDAAASGPLGEGGETWVEATVTGPGNVHFQWRISLPETSAGLRLEVDGDVSATLDERNAWVSESLYIPSGDHDLRWIYSRTVPAGPGPDPAGTGSWLDEVDFVAATEPNVTSGATTSIGEDEGTGNGTIDDDGGSPVTARGIVIGLSADPVLGTGTDFAAASPAGDDFTALLGGLLPGTTYHARAYGTNAVGTGYGDNVYFTTDETVALTNGLGNRSRTILPGDRQVFHFTLSSAREVDLGTVGGAQLRAELYNGNGNLIASFNGDTDIVLETALPAGNYSLHLFRLPAPGVAQTFDLSIDASTDAATLPDVAVGPSLTDQIGRGVRGAPGPLFALFTPERGLANGFATVVNAGNLPDDIRVAGSRVRRSFNVSYFGPDGNVTAAVIAGSHRTGPLVVGDAPAWIRAAISRIPQAPTAQIGIRPAGRKRPVILTIRATSAIDPAIQDRARIQPRAR